MKEKDVQIIIEEKESHGDHDYIESWFQTIINEQYHSNLKHLLEPYPLVQLVPHILASIEVHF